MLTTAGAAARRNLNGGRGLAVLLAAAIALGACDGDTPDAPPGPGRWEAAAPIPNPRIYAGVGAAREKVFVLGGFKNRTRMQNGDIYDTKTGTWSATEPLPTPYWMANVIGVGDRLFVLGGRENAESLEYDFASNKWLPRAPMPQPPGRGGAALGVYGNLALVAGGIVEGVSDNGLATGRRKADFHAYDVTKDSWQTLPLLPFDNGYAMGAVLGDQFWVIGGSTNVARTDQVLVFDLKANAWTTRDPPPKSISSAAVGVLGKRIIVTGGIATSIGMISPDTMVLDPATGTWTTASPLPTARFGMGGAVVGKRLFVPTGTAAHPTMENMFIDGPQMEVFSF